MRGSLQPRNNMLEHTTARILCKHQYYSVMIRTAAATDLSTFVATPFRASSSFCRRRFTPTSEGPSDRPPCPFASAHRIEQSSGKRRRFHRHHPRQEPYPKIPELFNQPIGIDNVQRNRAVRDQSEAAKESQT